MTTELKNQPRPIIEEFIAEINASKIEISNSKPIPFRDDKQTNKIRKAYKVPVHLLKFRKDNGRIASDVLTWEYSKGKLIEATDYAQSVIKRYLLNKDPAPTSELISSIIKEGQEELAVITADGFLINGNRRKMVLENLLGSEKYKGDERFKYLKVVILPGPGDNEPLPTLLELEQLENRYQLQRTGKAEYYNFDTALSIRRKEEMGMSLGEQLRDDPNFADLPKKELDKKIKEFQNKYLEPLKCVDRYLAFLNRPGHYNTVSEGKGDSEGRWQAFLDYYNSVYKKLNDERERIKYGIQDGEEGKIENIAFKLIRKRVIDKVDKKAHQVMRDLPKLLINPQSKKELFKLVNINFELPPDEILDEEGEPISETQKDKDWGAKYASDFIHHVRKAYEYEEQKDERDSPIELLNASLDKLNHAKMDITAIVHDRIDEAMKITRAIQIRANDLEHQLYDAKRKKSDLVEKFKKKGK
jgi:hypothetical protein